VDVIEIECEKTPEQRAARRITDIKNISSDLAVLHDFFTEEALAPVMDLWQQTQLQDSISTPYMPGMLVASSLKSPIALADSTALIKQEVFQRFQLMSTGVLELMDYRAWKNLCDCLDVNFRTGKFKSKMQMAK
jgi:hypothetical protein